MRPGASGILVGVSEEELGIHVLAQAGAQGTASGAPLRHRGIRVLSSKAAPPLLFWVTLLKPKVEGAGSASGSSASSRAGAVLAPDVNTTSHLPKPRKHQSHRSPRTIPAERHHHGNPQPCACRPAIRGGTLLGTLFLLMTNGGGSELTKEMSPVLSIACFPSGWFFSCFSC